MFIDTHAHLADSKFDLDRDLVIKSAQENKVNEIIEIGCEPYTWDASCKIADKNPGIYLALGIHPHEAKLATEELLKKLEELSAYPKFVAVGETGLDYYYNHSPKEVQVKVFQEQIEFAKKINKPLIIHCRDAYSRLIEILKNNPGIRGVVHCFSGNLNEAKEIVNIGLFLGIDGPVTYPNAKTLREVVKEMPLECMLLETDSPYLAPQQHRGNRNQPSNIPLIAREIAKIKNLSLETVAEITERSSKKLFGL